MTAGIMSQYFARTWKTFIMNGTSSSVSNHSPVKPTDNFSVRNSLRRLLRKFFFVADVEHRAVRVLDLFFLPIVEGRKGKMSILRTILSPHKMCRNDCHSLGHCRFEESPYSLSSRRFRVCYGGNGAANGRSTINCWDQTIWRLRFRNESDGNREGC